MDIIGDSGALQAAMQRRAGGAPATPAMNQQSPASAGYDPSMTPAPAPTGSAMPPMAQPTSGVPVSPTQTMGNDEAQLIVKTLAKRLGTLTPQV